MEWGVISYMHSGTGVIYIMEQGVICIVELDVIYIVEHGVICIAQNGDYICTSAIFSNFKYTKKKTTHHKHVCSTGPIR